MPFGSAVAQQIDPPDEDLQLLQGTWHVEQAVNSGEPVEGAETSYWVFAQNQVRMVVPRVGGETVATFELNPDSMPRTMRLLFPGTFQLAAYEIDGDSLIVCVAAIRNPAPNRFESTFENECMLVEFVRAAEDESAPQDDRELGNQTTFEWGAGNGIDSSGVPREVLRTR